MKVKKTGRKFVSLEKSLTFALRLRDNASAMKVTERLRK